MKRVLTLTVLCLVCLPAFAGEPKPKTVAAAKQEPPPKKPLFDRLGGKGAIEAVIDDFLGRVAKDERINAAFAVSNLPKVRLRLIELLCQVSSGPCTYSGRDLKTAHQGLSITAAQFDALAGHLVEALDERRVPEEEKSELLALVAPMKAEVVEEP